jgi:DNA-binding transcriptional LysR family regulator
MIDLRRLHVLRAVAHHGTVTAAAQALHLTPSAASQQVRQLARELGVALLEPQGRRVHLTAAARALLGHADAIEERWQRAEADVLAADPACPAGPLRMCGIPTAVSCLLAPAAADLRRRWPSVAPQVREAGPLECYDLVFSGDADLAVTETTPDGPPLTDTRFEQVRLLDDPFDLLTAPDHPMAGRDPVELAELAAEPWVLGTAGSPPRQQVVALCNSAGFTPSVVHEALEWTAVAHLVGHGLGVSLVPRLARLPDQPPVVRTPLTGAAAPTRRFVTVTRCGSRAAPAIAAGLALLRARAER